MRREEEELAVPWGCRQQVYSAPLYAVGGSCSWVIDLTAISTCNKCASLDGLCRLDKLLPKLLHAKECETEHPLTFTRRPSRPPPAHCARRSTTFVKYLLTSPS